MPMVNKRLSEVLSNVVKECWNTVPLPPPLLFLRWLPDAILLRKTRGICGILKAAFAPCKAACSPNLFSRCVQFCHLGYRPASQRTLAEVAPIPQQMVRDFFAADRGTTAEARASVRRSMVVHSRATDGRSASNCQEILPDQSLDHRSGPPGVLIATRTFRLSCKKPKNCKYSAGSTIVWRFLAEMD
jgi:hypothetical protein